MKAEGWNKFGLVDHALTTYKGKGELVKILVKLVIILSKSNIVN